MKWMMWVLLAANIAVAGFFMGRSYWPSSGADQTAPMNVDRLSLRSQAGPPSNEVPPPRTEEVKDLCVEWRGLNKDEFARVREQLKALAGERAKRPPKKCWLQLQLRPKPLCMKNGKAGCHDAIPVASEGSMPVSWNSSAEKDARLHRDACSTSILFR